MNLLLLLEAVGVFSTISPVSVALRQPLNISRSPRKILPHQNNAKVSQSRQANVHQ
jgi:hypothetical protein